jgi:hypothetical protein
MTSGTVLWLRHERGLLAGLEEQDITDRILRKLSGGSCVLLRQADRKLAAHG